MAENKKSLIVTEEVKELIYDIQNKAYLTGRSREADSSKSYKAASNMQASDDEEDGYQIRRSLANAFSSLKSRLGEYLSEYMSTSDNILYDEIENEGQLVLCFELPSNFNSASADSLGHGIHAYMVSMALSEWFAITNREDAGVYVSQAEMSLENVQRALYKRSRPERPSY